MKPARDPASSHPKPCASLKKPNESCPFVAPCGPRRKKNDRGQRSAFPSETSRFALSILAHRGSAIPWLGNDRAALRLAESGAYPPDRELPGSPRQCSLPLACRHTPEGHQIGARRRRTPENTILSQPYCRRVSTDRRNRESSQLAASLEGEPGPTPAGKTLPHSYPETRFRRERARRLATNALNVRNNKQQQPCTWYMINRDIFPCHRCGRFPTFYMQCKFVFSARGAEKFIADHIQLH